MGAALGCLAAEFTSCFTAAACRCACRAFNCTGSVATRLSYAAMFLATSITAWSLTTKWAIRNLEHLSFDYLKINCPDGLCYGTLAVHRVCFALTLFHFILACMLVGVRHSREPRAQIQNGWWGPKILLWIGLTVAAFFIPNGFFIGYGNYVAVIGAGLFIMIQLVLLVDFAHNWSEACLEKWEETNDKKWQLVIIGGSFALYATAITLTGLMYGFFGSPGCSLNLFLITFNLVLGIFATAAAIHPLIQESNPRSGLSQAAMVVVYTTYLITSAVAHEPKDMLGNDGARCNPIGRSGTQQTSVIVGALFTFLALVYSTSRAAAQGKALIIDSDYEPINAASAVPLTSSQPPFQPQMRSDTLARAVESGALRSSALDADPSNSGVNDDEREVTAYHYTIFHLIFAIASMYVAMLLTDWNTVSPPSDVDGGLVMLGQSMVAVWVKAVSAWVCIGLYVWTLVAPLLFPTRLYI